MNAITLAIMFASPLFPCHGLAAPVSPALLAPTQLPARVLSDIALPVSVPLVDLERALDSLKTVCTLRVLLRKRQVVV